MRVHHLTFESRSEDSVEYHLTEGSKGDEKRRHQHMASYAGATGLGFELGTLVFRSYETLDPAGIVAMKTSWKATGEPSPGEDRAVTNSLNRRHLIIRVPDHKNPWDESCFLAATFYISRELPNLSKEKYECPVNRRVFKSLPKDGKAESRGAVCSIDEGLFLTAIVSLGNGVPIGYQTWLAPRASIASPGT